MKNLHTSLNTDQKNLRKFKRWSGPIWRHLLFFSSSIILPNINLVPTFHSREAKKFFSNTSGGFCGDFLPLPCSPGRGPQHSRPGGIEKRKLFASLNYISWVFLLKFSTMITCMWFPEVLVTCLGIPAKHVKGTSGNTHEACTQAPEKKCTPILALPDQNGSPSHFSLVYHCLS